VAFELGGNVEMWLGNTAAIPYIPARRFTTHRDLLHLIETAEHYDIVLNCAAISDFIPRKKPGKIPSGKEVDVHLRPTPRVNPLLRGIGTTVVGFKLEAQEDGLVARALDRLRSDEVDMIVANTLKSIGSDSMKAWIITKEKDVIEVHGEKDSVAENIFNRVL
jgi:phosphopantothenoylcysteine synthetase/decarboxylase